MTGISAVVDGAEVLVSCGPGGVGKTTTSAAIGVAAARAGRRVCVITVDPARRLADALGVDHLDNAPTRIELDAPGELWATMLDTAATFDDIVRRDAATPETAERILANPLYRNLAGALSGTEEYMATERLYALHDDDRFDLVVVDTPPSRNALDLLDAPARLVRFLEHPLYRMLISAPTRSFARVVNAAARTFLWLVRRIAGGRIVDDTIELLTALGDLEDGIRNRSRSVDRLLRSTATRYVVVTSPRLEAVDEATAFVDGLRTAGLRMDGLVVNLAHPQPGRLPEGLTAPEGSELAQLLAAHAELRSLAADEALATADLVSRAGDVPVVRVAQRPVDVHDMAALVGLAEDLLPS